jgi:thioredoxin reductase
MPVLKKAGTQFLTSHKLLSVNGNGIVLEDLKNNRKIDLHVDYVVLSLGVRPDVELYNAIKDSNNYKVYNIGDSVKIGRIANATESAYQLAISL